ncbi:hypothetical protein FHS43_005277 [Streptosporangium becharense]|uniref:Uncharacterized protein n=1 Tax=Streptosporangium becharense TaxID=1816182 RepID=A0A7W9IIU5_9ACTN|nr:ALQxL family class IV lanthipeptide [Streptosporangium becharense]MBB2913968.1 hypothetical protein [Streptosporangium becharense]MBB5821371.1 hypothetical protein [Streptosporangium becharense]
MELDLNALDMLPAEEAQLKYCEFTCGEFTRNCRRSTTQF